MEQTRALFIGSVWPEPQSSAAGVRMMQLIRVFRSAGAEVHFAAPTRDGDSRDALAATGVTCWDAPLNDSAFDATVARIAPHWIVFDRFITEERYGWRARGAAPGAVTVLDTEDLHSLRRLRQERLARGAGADEILAVGADSAAPSADELRECASIYRCDLSLIISRHEERLLLDHWSVPRRLVHLTPYLYSDAPAAPRSFDGRRHVVTIGNFRHPPNLDGLGWWRREIWPRVRARLPEGAEFHAYGAYPPKEAMAWDDPADGFRVRGWVADHLRALQDYRLLVAPLRFGAGIKGKVTDSLWVGTPVVGTSIAWEGIAPPDHPPPRGSVADGVEAFAAAVAHLYSDAGAWSRAAEEGRLLVSRYQSWAVEAPRLLARLAELRAGLARERALNRVGALLTQQERRSTEYFGRWLELKESVSRGTHFQESSH
ncbi:MAG TPA: glycosyltransferase [Bdellovibrionota bacterium]|nr:glycosyltransferase [Bdellovibrionota bacterium]